MVNQSLAGVAMRITNRVYMYIHMAWNIYIDSRVTVKCCIKIHIYPSMGVKSSVTAKTLV